MSLELTFRWFRKSVWLATWVSLTASAPTFAQTAENVAVVINDASPESRQIGEYYIKARDIPAANVIRLKTTTDETIQPAAFAATIQGPIAAALTRAGTLDQVLYLVLTKGVPLRVLGTGGPDGTVASVKFTLPDGKTQDSEMANEVAQYTPAGVHSPTNVGANVDAVLVEFKAAAPGKATLPTTRPGMTVKVLAEGPRAMAQRVTAAPTFVEAAGTTHEYDQVVISLAASDQMSLSIAGKPARTKWARGDVEFIGRGVAHEAKNTGGKPVDFVIVSIK